ncbi:MAG: aspartate--tRNA ligase [Spirochaetaceae bacterium]|nr:MAG: aspartate--tRNA ligase [Spirochaetaceae bacterium]
MESMKRSVTCGELRAADLEKEVVLNGWVHRNRDHGGIQFINLRDRYGLTQVVIDQDAPEVLHSAGAALKPEYCVAVRGRVRARPDNMKNSEMTTGDIEVAATEIHLLSKSEVPPFVIDERSDAKDDLRLRYRYLDLRSFSMQRKIKLRHEVMLSVREYLSGEGFYEIETPSMIRSTPEGARDFLVPSRLHPGKFYALPQSPQLFKQLLMVSGFDRYFQLAHCFRDEDARGDRQPEHTQIDVEMSFVGRDDVFAVMEGMFSFVFERCLDVRLETPFPRISYHDAMNRYGSDKPDLRFELELQDFAEFVPKGEFSVFQQVLESGGAVRVLKASGCGTYSRKQITELEETAKIYGAGGLAWMKVTDQGLEGGVSRFYEGVAAEIIAAYEAKPGDLLLFVGADWRTACTALGAVRSRLGHELGLIDPSLFRFAWIVDFPLFEWNEDEQGWDAAHHMFSMPQEQYLETMESNPGEVKGDLYDLVCNGFELASGSIRIHDPELQKRVFKIVGFSEEEAHRRFGFLLEAFRYGPPPHGGIAPGLDRLVMIMAGESSIREVIAFPKNAVAVSPMDGSPAEVDEQQLRELGLRATAEAEQARVQGEGADVSNPDA